MPESLEISLSQVKGKRSIQGKEDYLVAYFVGDCLGVSDPEFSQRFSLQDKENHREVVVFSGGPPYDHEHPDIVARKKEEAVLVELKDTGNLRRDDLIRAVNIGMRQYCQNKKP